MQNQGRWIDIETWPRASTFLFYRDFERPFFNLCTAVDVAPTLRACREGSRSFFLATWFACMTAANEIAPLRCRVRGDRVWEHEKLFVGTTVLRADESFGFCYFPHAALFADFERKGQRALADFMMEAQC